MNYVNEKTIIKKNIEKELKKSYLSYATNILINRALPDIRDGLKPVHRKILYAMLKLNNTWDEKFKKSARIVGDVIGKYHPHGENSIYEAIVRMAQPFTLRYNLIEGHGNFGSIDGDSAAAMRYTEIKLSKFTKLLVTDLDKNTINYIPNYDNTEKIPEILPVQIPHLLINGTSGIAVGFITNIPPHNLKEVNTATIKLLKNPKISTKELLKYIKGPDFPTGGILINKKNLFNVYKTGAGKITIQAKIQENKNELIITELPYQINKLNLIQKITNLIKKKKIPEIINIIDETDKDGIHICLTLRKNTEKNSIINILHNQTQTEMTYHINMVALIQNKPQKLNLKKILINFIEHRKTTIINKLRYEIEILNKKIHILQGLNIIHENILKIINILKTINTKKNFLETINTHLESNNIILTKEQLKKAIELPLNKLTNLEKKELQINIIKYTKQSDTYLDIIKNDNKLSKFLENELTEITKEFGENRKTIIKEYDTQKKNNFNIIKNKNSHCFITTIDYEQTYININYLKTQKNKKKQFSTKITKEIKFIEFFKFPILYLLMFTNQGKFYKLQLKNYENYEKNLIKQIKLNNFIKKNKIDKLIFINEKQELQHFIIIITKKGTYKKIPIENLIQLKKKNYTLVILKKLNNICSIIKLETHNFILILLNNSRFILLSESALEQNTHIRQTKKLLKLKKNQTITTAIKVKDNDTHLLILTKKGFFLYLLADELKKIQENNTWTNTLKIHDIIKIEAVNNLNEIILIMAQNFFEILKISNLKYKQIKNKIIKINKSNHIKNMKKIEL